jgi:hypothetical protein
LYNYKCFSPKTIAKRCRTLFQDLPLDIHVIYLYTRRKSPKKGANAYMNVVEKKENTLDSSLTLPHPQKSARTFPLNGRIRRATPIAQETPHPSTAYTHPTTYDG